jgi:predicted dienelactone hydrolase
MLKFRDAILAAASLSFALASPVRAQQRASFPRADGKTVPVTVYAPPADSCRGIAVISPGAGGSERGYTYLGKGMASLGYLALVVGHQESGLAALRRDVRGRGLRNGLGELITTPSAYEGRFMDIAAARQWAAPRCAGAEAILLGHSMGAATVMMEAGAKTTLGVHGSTTFDAYVALSPQGVGSIFPADAWREIAGPMLMMTGTRDTELGASSWKARTEPFANMPPGCKWLGVVDGATHMDFSGNGTSREPGRLTLELIKAFLQGVHRHDCRPPQSPPGMTLEGK